MSKGKETDQLPNNVTVLFPTLAHDGKVQSDANFFSRQADIIELRAPFRSRVLNKIWTTGRVEETYIEQDSSDEDDDFTPPAAS